MFVSLILDKPHAQFTNLDIVSGRVQLRLTSPTQITTITVKLEGESRTRLLSPGRPELKEKPRPILEVHKVSVNLKKEALFTNRSSYSTRS